MAFDPYDLAHMGEVFADTSVL